MPPRRYIILAAAALLVAFISYQAIFKWPAEKQVLAKQEKFIASIESRKWGRVRRLTADEYQDSLGLDHDGLQLALKDAGSQFWTRFELNWEMSELRREGDAIVITGTIRVDGEGGPLVPYVIREARPFAGSPFTFRWSKTGAAPWTWQLESIHHPDASLPDGYRPGDIRRRTGFGEF